MGLWGPCKNGRALKGRQKHVDRWMESAKGSLSENVLCEWIRLTDNARQCWTHEATCVRPLPANVWVPTTGMCVEVRWALLVESG